VEQQGTTAATSVEDITRSIDGLLEKGTGAVKAFKMQEARQHFEEALKLARRVPESSSVLQTKLRILNELGEVLFLLGKWDAAREHFMRVLELIPDLTDHQQVARACLNIGEIQLHRGENREAMGFFERGHAMAREGGHRYLEAKALHHLGFLLGRIGRHQDGKARLQEGLEIVKADGAQWDDGASIEASLLKQLGLTSYRQGDLEEAMTQYRKALELVEGREHNLIKAEILRYIGIVESTQHNCHESLELYRKALNIYEESGFLFGQARLFNSIGQACLALSRLDEATYFMEKAEAICRELRAETESAAIHGKLGQVYMAREEYHEAIKYFQKDRELCEKFSNFRALAYTHRNLGNCYLYIGKTEEALKNLKDSRDIFRRVKEEHNTALVDMDLCNAYLNLGKLEEAEKFGQEALADFQERDMKVNIARTKALFGVISRHRKEYEQARRYLEESLEIMRLETPTTQLVDLLYELGLLCLDEGKKDEALSHFHAALFHSRELGLVRQVDRLLRVIGKIGPGRVLDLMLAEV